MRVYFQCISQISHQLMKNLNLVYKINATEGMKFSKNGCNWGGGGFFVELEEGRIWQEWEIFKVFFFSLLAEDANPVILWRPPPPILPTPHTPFSNFVHTSPNPTSLSPPSPHPHCSFCCHFCLAEWVITPHLMCYFT